MSQLQIRKKFDFSDPYKKDSTITITFLLPAHGSMFEKNHMEFPPFFKKQILHLVAHVPSTIIVIFSNFWIIMIKQT